MSKDLLISGASQSNILNYVPQATETESSLQHIVRPIFETLYKPTIAISALSGVAAGYALNLIFKEKKLTAGAGLYVLASIALVCINLEESLKEDSRLTLNALLLFITSTSTVFYDARRHPFISLTTV